MSYLTEGSERSMLTESNLFYVPPTLTERIVTHDVYIGPSAATFDDANDILFEIAPSTDLISLADIRFECEFSKPTDKHSTPQIMCAQSITS